MSSQDPASRSSGNALSRVPARVWVALALTLVAVLIIVVNWEQTQISFLLFTVTMPLAAALMIAFVGGMAAGAVLLKRRQSH